MSCIFVALLTAALAFILLCADYRTQSDLREEKARDSARILTEFVRQRCWKFDEELLINGYAKRAASKVAEALYAFDPDSSRFDETIDEKNSRLRKASDVVCDVLRESLADDSPLQFIEVFVSEGLPFWIAIYWRVDSLSSVPSQFSRSRLINAEGYRTPLGQLVDAVGSLQDS